MVRVALRSPDERLKSTLISALKPDYFILPNSSEEELNSSGTLRQLSLLFELCNR
jgi:hypothetical protein